ncbi:unnamed protein product [Dimorphilus gyrociliatus]|uniref:G-protein coupled receptors family 1 profile domain-containing protein n=1 Tax=Dimorphilus gyrociliatus TaxID=2664684 RepID=A0A7I8VMM6_9ANNE|nr:unnamed protein product [Dimorphilus gyrociliatus]
MTNYSSMEEIEPYKYDLEMRLNELLHSPIKMTALTLSLICILSNLLSAAAIRQTPSRIGSKAHFMLICSLTLSDALIGFSVALHMINKVLKPSSTKDAPFLLLVSECSYISIKALNSTSFVISLLNLVAMAIDHYLAILRPLHHPSLLTTRRTAIIISMLWIFSFIAGFSDFFTPFLINPHYSGELNYCKRVMFNKYNEEYLVFTIAFGALGLMAFVYVRIYLKVRQRHRMPLFQDTGEAIRASHQRALITTLLILGTFIITWLPLCLFEVVLIIYVSIDPDYLPTHPELLQRLTYANELLYDLLLMNTIADPLIYAIRTPEVRLGYSRLYYKLTCRSNKLNRHIKRQTSDSQLNPTYCSVAMTETRSIRRNDPSSSIKL